MSPLEIFLLCMLAVVLGAFAYMITKLILSYLNVKKAFHASWFNTKQCGEKKCSPPADTTNPPLPSTVSLSDWERDVAQYSAAIIYILEKAANDKTKPVYPKELVLQKELFDDKDDPVFASVLTNDNFIWIPIRGTLSSREWAQDLTYQQEVFLDSKSTVQVKLDFLLAANGEQPSVHKGFVDAYINFRQDLLDTLEKIDPEKSKTIIVCGHSIGAGISTILGADVVNKGYKAVVYNFASPRVGDQVFCDFVAKMGLKIFRVVNTADIVPNLPPSVSPNFKQTDQPYEYVHCGTLKAFADNWKSVLNNHLIGVYMKALKSM